MCDTSNSELKHSKELNTLSTITFLSVFSKRVPTSTSVLPCVVTADSFQ